MMIDQTKFLEKSIELAEIPGTALKISRVALGTWAIGGWMWGGPMRPNLYPLYLLRSTTALMLLTLHLSMGSGNH
jgi:hypothetical protein